MKVRWGSLSVAEANGTITKYEVCYKASESVIDVDCSLKETVNDGNTKEVTLNGLNEATTYNVAVKAANANGFGEIGPIMTTKTLEASKHFL
jgi:hypothetical protein